MARKVPKHCEKIEIRFYNPQHCEVSIGKITRSVGQLIREAPFFEWFAKVVMGWPTAFP